MHAIVPQLLQLKRSLSLQVEAHKKGSRKGSLQGLQGLALLQVGEVLYTANTAGRAEAILCRSHCCYPLLVLLTRHACALLTETMQVSDIVIDCWPYVPGMLACCWLCSAVHNMESVCVSDSAVKVLLAAEPL